MPARILIGEDFDDNRELLRLMLERVGHVVREARDGRELVAAALADPPDLILIDISMPVLDGWGALAALRSDTRTRAVPCVAVTAFAAERDRTRALEAGFDAHIAKPFRSTDLAEVIDRLIGRGGDGKEGSPAAHDGKHDLSKRDARPALDASREGQ